MFFTSAYCFSLFFIYLEIEIIRMPFFENRITAVHISISIPLMPFF